MNAIEREKLIQMVLTHEGGELGVELKAAKTLEEKRKIAEEVVKFLIGIAKTIEKEK